MTEAITLELTRSLMPLRPKDSYKGTFGYLLVIAGSAGLTGAACLTCEAALRAGVGMVTLGIPRSLNGAMEARLTETMTRPLPETNSGSLSLGGLDEIMRLASRMQAVAVGPGLSRNLETQRLVRRIAAKIDLPMVIDADGLSALVGRFDVMRSRTKESIFSPHLGEMSRLTGHSVSEIEGNREQIAAEYAAKWNVEVILKGAPSVVATTDGAVYVNTTGNSGMSTGGSGDVLTGILAALLCQGLKAAEAALLGTYLHGLAGDIAAKRFTERGMIASDIIRSLPNAWRKLAGEEDLTGTI